MMKTGKTLQFISKLLLLSIFVINTLWPVMAINIETKLGHVMGETNDGFLPSVGLGLAGDSLEDEDGKLYIVDKQENIIIVVDHDGYKKTFAGTGQLGFEDGPVLKASFKNPHGIVKDSLGNFYISDTGNNVIRKIDTDGNVSTFAGSGKNGADDGMGEAASFKTPMGLAIDKYDNLYVADQRNHLIRKISSDGLVSTLAGNSQKAGFEDGFEASFNYPESIALDSSGNIYIADKKNHAIRVLKPSGSISTIAGTGKKGNKDGDLSLAEFDSPSDLAIDSKGNLYIADTGNNSIKKIANGSVSTISGSSKGFWNASKNSYTESYFNSPYAISINNNDELLVSDLSNKQIRKINLQKELANWQVDTLIGTGEAGFTDGDFFEATITAPQGLAYDAEGNLYIADLTNNMIRKLSRNGKLSTVAGTATKGFKDGAGPNSENPASLNRPHSIAINSAGEIYFTDRDNHAIRKIDTQGNISTVTGSGKQGYKDGSFEEAEFNYPSGLAIDSNDEIYVADTNNHRIRKLNKDGTVTTVSGTKKGYSSGNINFARFNSPTHLAIDTQGNIYVSDQGNHKIRKISQDGLVRTIAGIGQGYQDGHGKYAQFDTPKGLAIKSGLLYLADFANNRIRVIDLEKLEVSTLSGSGLAGYKDGSDSLVSFKGPSGLILDHEGDLIVSDSNNHRIRKVKSNIETSKNKSKTLKKYYVATLAGNHKYDLVDGAARFASFKAPQGIVKDSLGNIFVADTLNHVIRKIDSEGNVNVFAGTGIAGDNDGENLNAQFSSPTALAIDDSDNLYIADTGNNKIKKISFDGYVSSLVSSGLKKPNGIALDNLGSIYISDTGNHKIKKLDSSNNLITIAGSNPGFKDGYGIYAKFNNPEGLAIDYENNIYVADFANNRVRKIDTDGKVTTLAGSGAASFLDGEAKYAQFNGPKAISIDSDKNLYISDFFNNKIRKISTDGEVSTLAGLGVGGAIDGLAQKASFNQPSGLAMDNTSILLCDSKNNLVRKIYKSESFAKEVLGFAFVSDEENTNINIQSIKTNTKPMMKLATNLDFHSLKNQSIPTYIIGTDLELELFSYDLEDGDEISNNIIWLSSDQGLIGKGKSFNIKNLHTGNHHITASVEDSGNLDSELSFDLKIIERNVQATTKKVQDRQESGIAGMNQNQLSIVLKITTNENQLFYANKKSRLNAAAFDISTNDTKDISNKIHWHSSIDGNLGSGAEIKAQLSAGEHLITAAINNHSDSITISVSNNEKKKILPKPKSLEQIDLPKLNLENPAPKQHEVKKDDEGDSKDNSIGIKDVKIRLL